MFQNVIVITGGAQRIGFALAKAFVNAGYTPVVSYRTPKSGVDELSKLGVQCVPADFSTDQGVHDFSNWLKQNVSSIRALIHNASDWLAESSQLPASETMARMMQIHATTPYLLNLALGDLLKACDCVSDIIHITDYTVEKGSPKHIAYAASKAAMDNLTLSFAKLYSPCVKVNTIAPSLIVFNDHDDADYREKTLKKSALGIEPGEAEVVKSVLYILDSQYMTGRQVKIDGGRHIV